MFAPMPTIVRKLPGPLALTYCRAPSSPRHPDVGPVLSEPGPPRARPCSAFSGPCFLTAVPSESSVRQGSHPDWGLPSLLQGPVGRPTVATLRTVFVSPWNTGGSYMETDMTVEGTW